jgi:hypothetical protein
VLINTAAKRAVAACLVIVTIAGALMSCRHVREAVADFFQNIYEAYTEFFFGDELSSDAPGIIEEIHMPAYIPEGYELIKESELMCDNRAIMTEWKNGSEELIRLHQYVLKSKTNIDTENADLFVVEDIEIAIIANETVINAFWNTDEYAYKITATGLSKEEALNIIKSIKY